VLTYVSLKGEYPDRRLATSHARQDGAEREDR
jgi:hypothetical protein